MRRLILAVLISTAGILAAAAGDRFTGDLTDAQINAIKMATIARFAGTKNICPRVHFVEAASFKVMADAGIRPDMLQSTEFGNVVTESALGAIEKQRKNPSDFCAATWQLFGSGSPFRWQMLEAN
ncbi:MAG: hypothetical protein JWP25_360 [Bradyrhizobium sp.]|nr:hypothetical protein [Bradyrhizobium sp.]